MEGTGPYGMSGPDGMSVPDQIGNDERLVWISIINLPICLLDRLRSN